ncbi:MAG: hypothetical protein IJA85_02825 [Clostridia bacterium]|nr:hypothetical protein [Clostridia bacterium]
MTSQKSYFNIKFALDSLRRSWPTAVLFTLILFFSMPVALLISVQNVDMQYVFTDVCIFLIVGIARCFTFVMAVFAGVVCFRHMHNRVSAYYYHSLPISREAHYIHMLTTGMTCYTAALLINTLLSQIILIGNYKLDAAYSAMLWQGSLQNLLFFALFFVITMLAGSLCGTSIVQLIIALVILYITPLMCASLVLLMTRYMRYMTYASDYFSIELAEKLSPGIRVITSIEEETICLGTAENLLYLFFTVIIAIAGIAIFRYRKAERANMPFIFPRFGSVVKYTVMVPITILSGIFFGSLMTESSFFWTVFGYVCGALLTFMAVNAVTQKNARAMFRNFKGFLIYACCAAAVIITVGFDLFSLNSFIPGTHNLTSVTMEANNMVPITFTDEAGMESLCLLGRAVQEYDESDTEYYSSADTYFQIEENSFYIGSSRHDTIKLTFDQKFGPTVIKRYSVDADAMTAIEAQLKAVTDTESFADAYLAKLHDSHSEIRSLDMWIEYFGGSSYQDYWRDLTEEDVIRDYNSLIDAFKASRSSIGWDYFQSPRVGTVSIYSANEEMDYRSCRYPVYLGDRTLSRLVDSLTESPRLDLPYSELFDSLYVINVENGKYVKLTEESEYAAVLEAFAGEGISVFTKTDDKYRILAVRGVNPDDLYKRGYSESEVTVAVKESGTYYQNSYQVLASKLPAFVINELE